jgi:hypothetical protein
MTSNLQSIPSSMKIREELERMVLSDLLGPVGGLDEEIAEPSVRDRYLVGMLAPKRQELSPEEFDELPNGGSGSVEDGAASRCQAWLLVSWLDFRGRLISGGKCPGDA